MKMKDTNYKICMPNDTVHKDVVIIGELNFFAVFRYYITYL